ncbi:MAG: hypothetical protein OXC68_01035 [Aestuariivita sp.]|nr:hypothetical protein [Aestuariivita sp.]
MARLEERMETMQAKYEGALDRNNAAFDRLRADMANFREDAEKREKDAAYRDKANIQWMAGLVLGAAVLIIAVLGILIRWPVP